MPTGYTAGILDGKITTFPQFAKQCMRAFGATIHMRDDEADAEYKERTPSDYHTTELAKANESLKSATVLSDEVIIANRKAELETSKLYHINSIEKCKLDTKNLNEILKGINDWNPPTSDHAGIKEFMADQILKTIDFDCKTEYHDKGLAKVEQELLTLNAKTIREEMVAKAKHDISYHTKELKADIKRCETSNKWVSDFINSLDNKYKEIEFDFGDIESAVKELNKYKERGELVYGEFNGQKLYSDIDDLDSAFKKITGKTKAEFDADQQKNSDDYREAERKHKEAILELTKEWIEKGNVILDEKYRKEWAKCVPIRLGDLYRGMELGNCLDIVEQLNKGESLEKVKPLIDGQGHSGTSFGLVCAMIKSFCERGNEFVAYVR